MLEKAVFAGGCFWCTEAIFKELKGVASVTSGYTGGTLEEPTYEQVSVGSSGHVEAIETMFDPKVISYEDLLDVFLRTHDPTTPDRQGADVGPQYRSVVFYMNAIQKKEAKAAVQEAQKLYNDPLVTDIKPFEVFYPAENYHQDYYEKNRNQTYCRLIIDPKIQKLKKDFKKYLKS